jgi:septum formation protein
MDRIILASASPRRSEILKQMGLTFINAPQHVDETFSGLKAEEEAVAIALKKTVSCLSESDGNNNYYVLGADTFIILENRFIGKPGGTIEAETMLEDLSGKTHEVITGLALHVPAGGIRNAVCRSEVEFERMSSTEIKWYVSTGEWRGAAGAYRIQQKGALFIKSVRGSYSNIMGLPINTFYGMLRAENFNFQTQ